MLHTVAGEIVDSFALGGDAVLGTEYFRAHLLERVHNRVIDFA